MRSSLGWLQRTALKQFEELQRNPSYQMALRHFEEVERNPALKMALKQAEEEARNPLLQVAKRSMRELDRLMVDQQLRNWERRIPDWFLNATQRATPNLDYVLGNLREVERIKTRLPDLHLQDRAFDDLTRVSREAIRRIESLDMLGVRNWSGIVNHSRELADIFRSLPREVSETPLGQVVQRLDAIRESAEREDSGKFDSEINALSDYLLGWVRSLLPHDLTSEGMLNIVLTILLTLAQIGLSYKWRLDDQSDAEGREKAHNEKLEAVLSAVLELKQNHDSEIGKPYGIERTTTVFARPGPKRPRVGYVYAGQKVRALATTGRWIFIEYADPFNLELRAGWIRKKYATLER